MRTSFLFLFLVFSAAIMAQQDIHTFQSNKVRMAYYGERLETDSPEMNVITLNLRDSTVSVQSGLSNISDFLNYQTEFQIIANLSINPSHRIFVTDGDYVFSFNYMRQLVQITTRTISPMQHFVRLEQMVY